MFEEPEPLWRANYGRYRGRLMLGGRARERLSHDHCTLGWVIVGRYPPRYIRGATEHPSVWSYGPDRIRFFRNYADGEPDWLSDGIRLFSQVEAVREHFERDPLVGHGMDWQIHNIDDPTCPVVLDWADFEQTWRRPRGRNSSYYRANVAFFAREGH